jgi:MFS family permease
MILTALTPRIPPPGYSQAEMQSELSGGSNPRIQENPTTQSLPVELPADTNTGWLGVAWILIAIIPAAIGGGMLQPSINSMITQRITIQEIGGTLGISAALLSAANAIAPLLWGVVFGLLGPSWPFILGGLALLLLLAVASRKIQPEGTSAPIGM